MPAEQELCVSSNLVNLVQISDYVANRAALAGLDEESTFDVQMAVDEACTNSIQHAYNGDAHGELRVCCYLDGRDFVVEVTDYGQTFDPDAVPDPDFASPLEERAIGGLGVYLMRRLMDSVRFYPGANMGNHVVMRKATTTART